MGLILSILAERNTHYDKKKLEWVNYCNMNQMVYFDIGFETGVPIGRVIIQMNEALKKNLTELFVKTARGEFVHPSCGKKIEYTGTILHQISTSKNMIMGGDVLNGNGCGRCAPVSRKLFQENNFSSTVQNTRGKVILLPSDTNPTVFSSLFYVLLDKSGPSVVDGCPIGDVIEGIEILETIVKEYGSENGRPGKKLIVHNCGHL
ncbi:PPIase cyclophilin-type domain-containing protein [Caenorhabditis elegans]|uniref:PPIase cyclophilin-type domain-containing protein n=1 Tax=Caenorhabditis elegans TaxID=6239 RepID=A3KFD7_CAEEL|nr:PPIase cyclophilin-type domain-containing protein [Caenorhabditis elegans]CCD71246.1 PPIase cyclophilin-type domain-containing protein [Caenorhabditis elegans]|eukprot:NP_001123073.1 Uncharacterized protein CELE_ZC250.5 [Caenorhabditis elegans]